jgi:hypothetical protein
MASTHRIALAPFQSIHGGVQSVVEALTPKGFLPEQLCLVFAPSSNVPLSSSLGSTGALYPHLVSNLQPLHIPSTGIPVFATAGPICDILLKEPSWLSSAAAQLGRHLQDGDVVLGVNGYDHEQFEHAARLMLRHASGNLSTHIFRWPHAIAG